MADEITYGDKEQGESSSFPTNQKWTFQDANEVKTVVNSHASDINDLDGKLISEFDTIEVDQGLILVPNGAGGVWWITNPTGIFFQNNFALNSTESVNRFIYNGTSNVTFTLAQQNLVGTDYTIYVENQTRSALSREVTILPVGGDTIIGQTVLQRGDLVSVEVSGTNEYTVTLLQSSTFVKSATGEGTKIWSVEVDDWIDSQVVSNDPLWTYDTDTTATDPTNGFFKFNNADITLATELYISNISKQGKDYTDILSLVGKGSIGRTQQWTEISNGNVFEVENVIDNTGWHTLEVKVLGGQNYLGVGTIDVDIDIVKLETEAQYFNVDSSNFSRPSQVTEGLISTSNVLQDYLTLNFTAPRDGTFELKGFYEWSFDANTQDFLCAVQLDDLDAVSVVDLILEHRQEPQDSGGAGIVLDELDGGLIIGQTNSGTDQRFNNSFIKTIDLVEGTNYSLVMKWASGDNTSEATVYNANMIVEYKKG